MSFHQSRATNISLDSFPVHYPVMDAVGINFNLEKNLYNLSIEKLQDPTLPWWDKTVYYTNYFGSAVNLFFPIKELKEIWIKSFENDPYSTCQNFEIEYNRIEKIEYHENIPHVLHCLLMREKQFFTSHCNSIAEKYDSLLMVSLSQIDKVQKKNNDTRKLLTDIIEKTGKYPGRSTVGLNLETVAWSVIQSGDLAYISKYLPLLKDAVKSGDLHPRYLATTLDKIEILKGNSQIYGTQFKTIDGKEEVYPIRDMQQLNELRTGMGLGPFETSNSSLWNLMTEPNKSN
ncbi:MAG TPA: DUF6624 domain-containing protein [Saprospiraceae bacterium]|nr:DUF6624 domain-containing protein [Saprospiraceae bacterium]